MSLVAVNVALNRVPDRRASLRRSISVPARVSLVGGSPLDALTIDLSSDSANLVSTWQLNLGQDCLVEIGIGRPELLRPLTVRATVCYCVGTGPARYQRGALRFRTGLQFTGLSAGDRQTIAAILA